MKFFLLFLHGPVISWMQPFKSQDVNLDILYIQWVGQIFFSHIKDDFSDECHQCLFAILLITKSFFYFISRLQAIKLCFMKNGVQPQTLCFGRDKTRGVALINSRIFFPGGLDSSEGLREMCNQNPKVLLLWHKTFLPQNVQGYLLWVNSLDKKENQQDHKRISELHLWYTWISYLKNKAHKNVQNLLLDND